VLATGIRVLGDRVLVRVDEAEATQGGIFLPESAQEKPKTGIVVSVGEGRRLEDGSFAPVDVEEGDRVLFTKYGGTEIKVDGEELMVMSTSQILGTLEKDA
jgi:chaperonin GroES